MTITELLSGGGGIVGLLLVLLTLVQIAPIKVNPWTAIGKAVDARNADMHRAAILRFNNELLRDIPHTREEFFEVLSEIDFYEQYCDTHKEYINNRATHAAANIKRVYDDRLIKHDFL